MNFPNDFQSELANAEAQIPADVLTYFNAVESAGDRSLDISTVDTMGAQETIKAARDALKHASFILCTDDPRYAEARETFNTTIEPAVEAIAAALAGYAVPSEELKAIALGAFRVVYRLSIHGFCKATTKLRVE